LAYKIQSVEFIKSAARPEQFISTEVPEVAFAGRSNVGKSSLLNVLVQRKAMAKVAKAPGKTRLVNFFDVRLERAHLRLVDLPGYGFAKVGKVVQQSWAPLVEEYIAGRPNMKLVCSLIDYRHEPTKLDIQLVEWLQHEKIPYLVVLTKSDKLKKNDLVKNKNKIRKVLGLEAEEQTIPFSSLKREGRDELWKAILTRL
jgi:GTP-binding protein